MKCISLWQPWASLLVSGEKKIETRHWPIKYRGMLIIHAAKTKEECFGEQLNLPFGALVGIVKLIDCKRSEDLRDVISKQELHHGNYGDGRFGWVTTEQRAFARPIPYRGMQGLFEVPISDDVETALRELGVIG